MEKQPEIVPLPEAGLNRTILKLNDQPALCVLLCRHSTTAPARVKAVLAVPVDQAQAAKVAEFRLEMN